MRAQVPVLIRLPSDSPAVATGFKASYNNGVSNVTGLITMATGYANYAIDNGNLTPLAPGFVPTRHFFSNEVEYYAQDTWKVTPKLTFTYGFRHTLLQVPYERNSQQVVPTVSLNDWFNKRMLAASQGGVNQPNISFTQGGQASGRQPYWQMDKADIAPRFAFSYAPHPSMTIRGGYGIYYDHFGNAIVDALDQRGSFGLSSTLSNGASQFVDTAPRFSSLTSVPASLIPPIANPGSFPVTPPIGAGLTAWVLVDKMKTPYAHVMDFSIQQEMRKGLVFELDYVGRLGRQLMQQLDLAGTAQRRRSKVWNVLLQRGNSSSASMLIRELPLRRLLLFRPVLSLTINSLSLVRMVLHQRKIFIKICG